jgi:predicted dehydrogenase
VTPRLALLGCGWVADMHARAAATVGLTVAGVANHRLESAQRFGAVHGIERVTTDWRALVSAPDVDVVVVCTPNALHAEQSIAALEAGKHVLCEKPMATTVADGEAMLAAAALCDRLLLVLHPWRHHDAVIAVRDAIVAGELGRVVRTHGYGVHADWGPGGWFTDLALAGGGALVDMGIHAIDTARFLLGEPEPRRVLASITTAHGDYAVDDDCAVLIEWEGGARSVVESGWWQPHLGGHEADTEVYGSTGYRRIWAREQPPGYVHCDVTLFIAQLRNAMAQVGAWHPGTPSPRHGLVALRVCELAYASAGVGARNAG